MINKLNTIFECSKCGAQSTKWAGRCLECGAWGSLEEVQSEKSKVKSLEKIPVGKVINFSEITGKDFLRIETGIGEFDQVLGGGIVPGSLILLGGDPGIGKSTLVAQVAAALQASVLYVSGEESAEQVKMRLDRLHVNQSHFQFLSEEQVEVICKTIITTKPACVIIDSIQTVASSFVDSEPGSINQIKASTVRFLEV